MMTTSHATRSGHAPVPSQRTTSTAEGECERIVVSVTDSFWGLSALAWAAEHARATSADLDVCPATAGEVLGDLLDRQIASLRRAMPTRAVAMLPCGDAATVLIGQSSHVGLIVLGCHSIRHQSLGVGAAAATVAQLATCDVVVVRGRAAAVQGAFRHTSVLLDGSVVPQTVRCAARFARCRGTRLRILWQVGPVGRGTHQQINDEPFSLQAAAEFAERVAPGVPIETRLAFGGPHEVVAQLDGDDMLVVGVGDRLDAVARAALHHASSPVLLSRHRADG